MRDLWHLEAPKLFKLGTVPSTWRPRVLVTCLVAYVSQPVVIETALRTTTGHERPHNSNKGLLGSLKFTVDRPGRSLLGCFGWSFFSPTIWRLDQGP